MASGVLGLLDDIAVLMDDVATMSKVATKKTAGILADDLAVNAEKASGFVSSRELPVLWKLTKGSFLNKVIILPAVFLLSAFLPVAIVPILLCGGIYLSFEGALKSYEYLFHKDKKKKVNPGSMTESEASEYESKRIKSAILIDFILSIEIIIIALGTVLDEPLKVQIPVVTFIAILATIGVYGIVALLVRIDDAGFGLIAFSDNKFLQGIGNALVKLLPIIIRILNIVGTLAMILVGGGIFVHNLHFIHDLVHGIPALLAEFLVGLVAGFIFLGIFLVIKAIFKKRS
jgi:predicted DNA repair protein MutK